MRKIFFKTLIFLIIIIIACGINKVFAADNYTCNLLVEGNMQIQPGQSTILELKAINIQAETGIISFEALINYNSDVFDCRIETDSDGNWNKTGMIENYLTMTRSDLMPNAQDQVIARIILTAKESAPIGEYQLSISRIKFTMDNDKYFELSDVISNIAIANEQHQSENNNTENSNNQNTIENNGENTENQNTNTSTVDNQNTITNNNETENQNINTTNEDNQNTNNYTNNISNFQEQEDNNTISVNNTNESEDENNLPYSGLSDGWIVIAISVCSIFAYVLFKKYKKFENI